MEYNPRLRFKEFNDNYITKPFSEFGTFYYGKGAPKTSISKNAKTPCVRYGELYSTYKEVINDIKSYTTINPKDLKLSKGGEVLIPRVGENPKDFCYASYLPFKDVAIGEMISVFNTSQNGSYIAYLINGKLKSDFSRVVEGGNVSNLYFRYLMPINISVPKLVEQAKVVSFLTSVDEKINLLTKKKELLMEYKKGVMQKIFSQEIRFKDDNGNDFPVWNKSIIGEIGEIVAGKTPSTKNKDLWGGDIQFITPSDIKEQNKYQDTVNRYVVKTNRIRVLPKNTIVYTCVASIGKMCLSVKPCTTNQQINSLIPNSDYSNEFIYYSLYYLTPKIKSTVSTTTLPIITKTDFSNFKINVPSSLKEQIKIANFLSSLDKKIDLVNLQIEKTKEFKKGLLQQMFV